MLVGFVREHIEAVKPPRALWLNFPMGRPLGKPNDPDFQKGVIRAAFKLFEALSGPVLEDFSEVIPIRGGRMSYALPDALLLKPGEVGDMDVLLAQVQVEVAALQPDYEAAKAARGRTTVGATELGIEELAPFIAQFTRGEKVKKSPRKGVPPPLLRTDVCPECLPVIRHARVGAQTEEPARYCVKRIPSAAMRSRLGVSMFGWPRQDSS